MNIAEIKNLYDKYSDTELHTGISEVDEAETELTLLLHTLPDAYRDDVDMLIGKLTYAYEKQGFVYAASVLAGRNERTRGLAATLYDKMLGKNTTPIVEGRKKPSATKSSGERTPVLQCDAKTGEVIAKYASQTIAHQETGIVLSGINDCVRGRQKTCGGFAWRYAEATS